MTQTDKFVYARPSAVPNAGDDLANSARHRVNAWRSLGDAEAAGKAVAAQLITRDQLLKNEPLDLSGLTDNNSFAYYMAYCILKTFPPNPFTGDKPYGDFALRTTSASTDAELREQFYETYMELKALLVAKIPEIDNPVKLLAEAKTYASTVICRVRRDGEDKYNPFANTLVDFSKRVRISNGRQKANTVGHKVVVVMLALNAKGLDTKKVEDRPAIRSYLEPLIQGKSFSQVFEVEGKSTAKKPVLKESDQYFDFIERIGGKQVHQPTDALAFDMLLETFMFRGVQWGNSMPDKERSKHLQHIIEAFADLADITGLDYPDMGLKIRNRHMGLAFGARGSSNVLAHYEPGEHVTNLTRKRGFGAVAHEWWHAFDHMLACEGELTQMRFMSQLADRLAYHQRPAECVMSNTMIALVQAIFKSGYMARLRTVLTEYIKKGFIPSSKRAYWLSIEEVTARAFERYVQVTLQAQGRQNTYLSGNSGHELWMTEEEVLAVTPAFEQVFQTYLQGKPHD